MIMQVYWEIQKQEKELLKEIAKWKYRAKYQQDKRFYSDRQLDLFFKYGEEELESIGEWTAQDRLNQYKKELKALRTLEYKRTKRFLNKKG